MKKTMLHISFVLLSLLLVLSSNVFLINAEGIDICTDISDSNLDKHNYEVNADVITSYLVGTSDERIMRFQAESQKWFVEYYDYSFELLERIDSSHFALELPIFGGFYATEEYYYILTGQSNPKAQDYIESFRITQYDLSWNRITHASLYGINSLYDVKTNTVKPFAGGTARFIEKDNYIFIRSSHEMSAQECNVSHQANITILLDTSTMEIIDAMSDVSNNDNGYISHSFNQFLQIDGNKLVAVDHGDAKPRSIALTIYPALNLKDENKCNVIDVINFPGEITDNITDASVGSFQISDENYLIAYNYGTSNDARSIYVSAVNKTTFTKSQFSINEQATSLSTPYLIEINKDKYVLLWSNNDDILYTAIDGDGKRVEEILTIRNASLSDCEPIVIGSKLIWYTFENNYVTFYDICLEDITITSKNEINNNHNFVIDAEVPIEDDYYEMYCEKCGYRKKYKLTVNMYIIWRLNNSNEPIYSIEDTELSAGDRLFYNILLEGDASDNSVIITVSDTNGIIHTNTTSNGLKGFFTMVNEGEYVIDFTYKYNSLLTTSVKVNVKGKVHGDINRNGAVDAIDYILLKRHYFGTYTLNDEQFGYADINSDGKITPIDYILCKRIYFGTYKVK